MKRIILSLVVLSSLVSSYAYAVTYTFTGDDFTSVSGSYVIGSRVTGTLITSAPIPANYYGDLSGILTSWSFNDGVQTINNVNGTSHPNRSFNVGTDGLGNITSFDIFVSLLPLGTAINHTDDTIWIEHLAQYANIDADCVSVQGGYCSNWNGGVERAYANTVNAMWVTSDLPVPPIPTLSQWTLMLLAMMLGMVGIARVRKPA